MISNGLAIAGVVFKMKLLTWLEQETFGSELEAKCYLDIRGLDSVIAVLALISAS